MSGMKHQTIKRLFNSVINKWLESITDLTARYAAEKDVIVSGGAIASALMGEKINDYDLYFRTRETAILVANYYVSQFNAMNQAKGVARVPVVTSIKRTNIKGVEEDRIVIFMKSSGVASETQTDYQYFEGQTEEAADEFMESLGEDIIGTTSVTDPEKAAEDILKKARSKNAMEDYRPVFLSENAITLSNKIQLVIRFFGEPEEIHENYDYVHAMCYYDFASQKLNVPAEAMEAMLSKTLIYKGSLYPIASLFRLRKFIDRGWRITAGQILKIVMQLNEVDLKDTKTLREQLIGVDQAYMFQLLREIEENKSERIDSTYIAKLIDKLFE